MKTATKEKPPRKQHLVPRAYLERFADEHGRIRMIDRNSHRAFERAVSEFAVHRDFYTIESGGSRQYDMERHLADIEGAGIEAIRRICDRGQSASADDIQALTRFVAFQIARGAKPRRAAEAIADVMRSIFAEGGSDVSSEGFIPRREDHLRTMWATAQSLYRLFHANFILTIATLPRISLITGDEPVALHVYPERRLPGLGFGPATADEVWLPLDPHHLLIMSPHSRIAERLRELPPRELADGVNHAVAAGAHEWIFTTPGYDLIDFSTLPPPTALVEVNADLSAPVDGVGGPPERRRPRRD